MLFMAIMFLILLALSVILMRHNKTAASTCGLLSQAFGIGMAVEVLVKAIF